MWLFGEAWYAMRHMLDPATPCGCGLTKADVTVRWQSRTLEIPAGQVGPPPSDEKTELQDTVRDRRLSQPAAAVRPDHH